jgi:hypothetical protein
MLLPLQYLLGNTITCVDGFETSAMSDAEVAQLVVGPVGTSVELLLVVGRHLHGRLPPMAHHHSVYLPRKPACNWAPSSPPASRLGAPASALRACEAGIDAGLSCADPALIRSAASAASHDDGRRQHRSPPAFARASSESAAGGAPPAARMPRVLAIKPLIHAWIHPRPAAKPAAAAPAAAAAATLGFVHPPPAAAMWRRPPADRHLLPHSAGGGIAEEAERDGGVAGAGGSVWATPGSPGGSQASAASTAEDLSRCASNGSAAAAAAAAGIWGSGVGCGAGGDGVRCSVGEVGPDGGFRKLFLM